MTPSADSTRRSRNRVPSRNRSTIKLGSKPLTCSNASDPTNQRRSISGNAYLIPIDLKLYQKLFHDVTVHVCQPEISALIPIGQLRVVNAKLVEDSGVKIMDVNRTWREVIN